LNVQLEKDDEILIQGTDGNYIGFKAAYVFGLFKNIQHMQQQIERMNKLISSQNEQIQKLETKYCDKIRSIESDVEGWITMQNMKHAAVREENQVLKGKVADLEDKRTPIVITKYVAYQGLLATKQSVRQRPPGYELSTLDL